MRIVRTCALIALFCQPVAAQTYSGGIPEADKLLNDSPHIEQEIAARLHAESLRLQRISDVVDENCSLEGTGDARRDLRCGMILGGLINSRAKLMRDIQDARDGKYQPDREIEDPRCAIAKKFSDPSFAERAGVKCEFSE